MNIKFSFSMYGQRGATMLEVLITIVILTIGLLGLAGLQAKLQSSEMESYQRAQALLLLKDMAGRIAANRNNAANYVSELGAGMTCSTSIATQKDRDLKEWCEALQGAAEQIGTSKVGAMIGGRGCVSGAGSQYMVTVAWQGLIPISAPPASVACGLDAYNATGTACTGDLCRRVVTTIVNIANL